MKEGTCRHYNGLFHNRTCDAGINYHVRFGDEAGIMKRAACFARNHTTCEKYREPTEAELAEVALREESFEEMFTKMLRLIVETKTSRTGEDWDGIVDCPVCSGKVRISYCNHNGHTAGRCSSEDCLSWIE